MRKVEEKKQTTLGIAVRPDSINEQKCRVLAVEGVRRGLEVTIIPQRGGHDLYHFAGSEEVINSLSASNSKG